MSDLEKLFELLVECDSEFNLRAHYPTTAAVIVAGYLLANGVAVGVVRCRDCNACDTPEDGVVWCYQHDTATDLDGFCYCGERRAT